MLSRGLTLAVPAVRGKREAAMAGTLEASWLVLADLAAAPVLLATLVDIWTWRKREGLLPGHSPAGLRWAA